MAHEMDQKTPRHLRRFRPFRCPEGVSIHGLQSYAIGIMLSSDCLTAMRLRRVVFLSSGNVGDDRGAVFFLRKNTKLGSFRLRCIERFIFVIISRKKYVYVIFVLKFPSACIILPPV